jgi:hypothetical protein
MSEKTNAVTHGKLQRALGYVALAVIEGDDDYADLLAWMESQIELARKGDAKAHAQALLESMIAARR